MIVDKNANLTELVGEGGGAMCPRQKLGCQCRQRRLGRRSWTSYVRALLSKTREHYLAILMKLRNFTMNFNCYIASK